MTPENRRALIRDALVERASRLRELKDFITQEHLMAVEKLRLFDNNQAPIEKQYEEVKKTVEESLKLFYKLER